MRIVSKPFFCVSLAPVMGFIDVGFMQYSLVADHYQHLAMIAVIALVAAGFDAWHQRLRDGARWAAIIVAILTAGVLTFLTWRQSGLYINGPTLYKTTLEKNPDCWMAHNNLGFELAQKGVAVYNSLSGASRALYRFSAYHTFQKESAQFNG